MKVKRCFSFSDTNNTVALVDDRGCPDPSIMSPFVYNRIAGVAEAELHSMFKFPESHRVHFQCDILVCKGEEKHLSRFALQASLVLTTFGLGFLLLFSNVCKNLFHPRPDKAPLITASF